MKLERQFMTWVFLMNKIKLFYYGKRNGVIRASRWTTFREV